MYMQVIIFCFEMLPHLASVTALCASEVLVTSHMAHFLRVMSVEIMIVVLLCSETQSVVSEEVYLKSFHSCSIVIDEACFYSMAPGTYHHQLYFGGTAAHHIDSSAYSGMQVSFSTMYSNTANYLLLLNLYISLPGVFNLPATLCKSFKLIKKLFIYLITKL